MVSPSELLRHRVPTLDLVVGSVVLLAIIGTIVGLTWHFYDKHHASEVARLKKSARHAARGRQHYS